MKICFYQRQYIIKQAQTSVPYDPLGLKELMKKNDAHLIIENCLLVNSIQFWLINCSMVNTDY